MARLFQVTSSNLLGALNLILVIVCAYVAAQVVHNLKRPEAAQAPVASASAPNFQVSSPPRVFAHYQPILDRNLFKANLVEKVEPPPEEVPEKIEESPLQAKLIATVVSGDEAKSSATIEDQTTRTRDIYHLKGMLMNEAQVVKIARERVIVLRGGVHEALSLYEDKNAAKGAVPRMIPPFFGLRPGIQPGITAPPGGLRGFAPPAQMPPGSSSRMGALNALRRFNASNQDFRVMPHFQSGRIDGLRVIGLATTSKWSQAGLRNGDIVRSINGRPLSGVAQFYQSLQGGGRTTIEIERGKERTTVTYQGEG